MSDEDEIFCRLGLEGPIGTLASRIAACTGTDRGCTDPQSLEEAIGAAFPDLPRHEILEGCTTHPALIARIRAPGSGRERAKLVFVPQPDHLEIRLRAEIPAGSYRKETLLRMVSFLETIEKALGDR